MRPIFYCENCGKEVSANDKICPHCGKFFTDVRCPRCDHSGDVDEFSFGCPKCGYQNPSWITGAASSASASSLFEVVSSQVFGGGPVFPEVPRRASAEPPAWFFLSLTIGIGTICAAIVYLLVIR